MTESGNTHPIKSALLTVQAVGRIAGLDLSALTMTHGHRTAEHIAEVLRLGQEHAAQLDAIDRYSEQRGHAYDDESNEAVLSEYEANKIMSPLHQVAKTE